MLLNREIFKMREDALVIAQAYVELLMEKYPPETFSDNLMPAAMFQSPAKRTVTQAEQSVNLMIQIADWLVQNE